MQAGIRSQVFEGVISVLCKLSSLSYCPMRDQIGFGCAGPKRCSLLHPKLVIGVICLQDKATLQPAHLGVHAPQMTWYIAKNDIAYLERWARILRWAGPKLIFFIPNTFLNSTIPPATTECCFRRNRGYCVFVRQQRVDLPSCQEIEVELPVVGPCLRGRHVRPR